jgi:hypothetical protein
MAERFLKTRELFPMSELLTLLSFSSIRGGYLSCKENKIVKDDVNDLQVVNEISSMSGGNHDNDNYKVSTRKLKGKRGKPSNFDNIKKRLQKIKKMMK